MATVVTNALIGNDKISRINSTIHQNKFIPWFVIASPIMRLLRYVPPHTLRKNMIGQITAMVKNFMIVSSNTSGDL